MQQNDMMNVLREAADRYIRPRFRALQSSDVIEKSPGELVTIADREAEMFITSCLRKMRPGIAVIGEEATAENASLLDSLYRGESCWLLDPLDGTNNFIAGDPQYGIAVALIELGDIAAAWIWQPELGNAWEAARGEGTRKNGVPIRTSPRSLDPTALRGTLHARFMPPEQRAIVEQTPIRHIESHGSLASAIDYPKIIEGDLDFVGWSRLLPWDHAPGALLLTEAGGDVRHLNGSAYRADVAGTGSLAARTSETWEAARALWPASLCSPAEAS